jgi:hypothetical protein
MNPPGLLGSASPDVQALGAASADAADAVQHCRHADLAQS